MSSFESEFSSILYGCESALTLPAFLLDKEGPHVILVPENQFELLKQNFLFFNPQQRVFKLPALDPWFPARPTMIERTQWLYQALHASSTDIFLCSYKSLVQKTLSKKLFKKHFLKLSPHSLCPDSQSLKKFGYLESFPPEEAGFYFQKGGILDIYTPQAPIRIQTLGDYIESIYYYNPKTQMNISPCPSIILTPLYESFLTSNRKLKNLKALKELPWIPLEFINKLSRNVFFSEKSLLLPLFEPSCEQAFDFFEKPPYVWCLEEEFSKKDELKNLMLASKKEASSFLGQILPKFYFQKINFPKKTTLLRPLIQENKSIFPVQIFKKFKEFPSEEIFKNHFSVLATSHESHLKYIEFKLKQKNLFPQIIQGEKRNWSQWKFEQLQEPQKVHLILGNPSKNFKTQDSIFLKADSFLKIHSPDSVSKIPLKLKALHFSEIQVGDLIVDKIHGVGRYKGLKALHYGDSFGEYIELEYKDKNRLYVPVSQINRLYQFKTNLKTFHSENLLDSLGNFNWKQKVAKAQRAIKNLVLDLLKLYSARKKMTRKPFSPKSSDLEQFEKEFPFEETQDQKQAIEDIYKDMCQSQPMDRLIIGDSGYGKTEVAMRASFKAVEDSYQVVFLAPTTILSLQHFENFKKRFQNWPLRIELLNRLIPNKKIKSILKDLEEGKVDILIGSHRILSSDIQFNNLGLVIIDEEHRFGVKQKEKLKKFKLNVDCIYMSATPIPRTLSLGLNRTQDISLIQTPPQNRIASQVFVIHFKEEQIRQAIEREIQRGGQVLFVHNRVQTIGPIYEKLSSLFPHLSIQIAHGQMNEQELEKNILNFFQHKSDILLCTTIVESGMDFSKTNTILINNASTLGLSQLYQLKGRVGRRSSVQPYCYFILPQSMPKNSSAIERINFLQTHSHLSSGYQIARYDLEIRGGGDFLGSRQSGHISDIGYDLFLDMLEAELNPSSTPTFETEVKLPFEAYIPLDYIPHDKIRLMYYKHLGSLKKMEELQEIEKELKDSFGPLPIEVKNLFGQILIQHQAQSLKIKELKTLGQNLYINYLSSSSPPEKLKLPESFSWVQIYDLLLSKSS